LPRVGWAAGLDLFGRGQMSRASWKSNDTAPAAALPTTGPPEAISISFKH